MRTKTKNTWTYFHSGEQWAGQSVKTKSKMLRIKSIAFGTRGWWVETRNGERELGAKKKDPLLWIMYDAL